MVRPVQIIDRQTQRTLCREVRGQPEQPVQGTEAIVAPGAICVRWLEHARGGLRRAREYPLATAGLEQQRFEQLTDDPVGQLPFEIAASRAQHLEAGRTRHLTRVHEEPTLSDPGGSLNQREDGLTRPRRLHDTFEALEFAVALEQNTPAGHRRPRSRDGRHRSR